MTRYYIDLKDYSDSADIKDVCDETLKEVVKDFNVELQKRGQPLPIDNVSKRLYGVYCTYEDEEGELISVHKTEKGAIKNKEAQTNYQQNYYHTDFVLLWD